VSQFPPPYFLGTLSPAAVSFPRNLANLLTPNFSYNPAAFPFPKKHDFCPLMLPPDGPAYVRAFFRLLRLFLFSIPHVDVLLVPGCSFSFFASVSPQLFSFPRRAPPRIILVLTSGSHSPCGVGLEMRLERFHERVFLHPLRLRFFF